MTNVLRNSLLAWGTFAVFVSAGCANDPRYIAPQEALEVNAGGGPGAATATIILPIRLEETDEIAEREQIAAELGVTAADIPYVKVGDLDVSLEWSLRNLDDTDGIAFVDVNGGNEWFRFVPDLLIVDPDDPNEPPPPSLIQGIPLEVPASSTLGGVVREGQVYEGSVDLELITRGAYNPIAAVLQVNEDTTEFNHDATGVAIPSHLFAGMVEFTLNFSADRHMVLEFALRVRDQRGLLHDDLDQAAPEELTQFAPQDYVPVVTAP
jgi:hypothetical protein